MGVLQCLQWKEVRNAATKRIRVLWRVVEPGVIASYQRVFRSEECELHSLSAQPLQVGQDLRLADRLQQAVMRDV